MAQFWQGLSEDFSDLPDTGQVLRITVRLLVAAALGGLLGFERQRQGKEAGLRTHMLVALGAALFVLVPQQSGMKISDLSRVLQGIITGVGFIGAGTILKLSEVERVKGLTTAASIWMTAAVGLAAGMGRQLTALLGTVLALLILSALRRLELALYGEGNQEASVTGSEEPPPPPGKRRGRKQS